MLFKNNVQNLLKNNQFLKRFIVKNMSLGEQYRFVKDGKKILGAALNYLDIVKARNVPVPKVPIFFLKPTSSYIVEGENIIIPKSFSRVVHEVELGVIIGKECKNVSKNEAMSYVTGYCLALDLTAQCELGAAREKGQPWTIGKGFDTSCPVSRFIPLSEIKDPHNIMLRCDVNKKTLQQENTSEMIFKVPDLIEYISKYMTLEPNDLILTGTPDGASPLKHGDVIECSLGDIVKMKFFVKSE